MADNMVSDTPNITQLYKNDDSNNSKNYLYPKTTGKAVTIESNVLSEDGTNEHELLDNYLNKMPSSSTTTRRRFSFIDGNGKAYLGNSVILTTEDVCDSNHQVKLVLDSDGKTLEIMPVNSGTTINVVIKGNLNATKVEGAVFN